MNPAPDYSAAYCILETDDPRLEGHGLTFTIGRGNELCCAAIQALAPLVEGMTLDAIRSDGAAFWRRVTGDSQLRWVGPDKGVIHLAAAAVINAVWDLWGKVEGKPVWQLVGEMTPGEIVRLIDLRYLGDCIGPEEARDLLEARSAGKQERLADLRATGVACYTTSAGWLGYSDEDLRHHCERAVEQGFNHVKLKVGRSLEDDIRRLRIAREVIGPARKLMIDANQVWEVTEAADYINALRFADPWFVEEPTSPDDIEGHRKIREAVAPIRIATGEMSHNRIMFKQFIMRGALDVVQLDNCRLGGLNEVLAVLLMAAKYDLPVCPHAGGVGLCEYAQHLTMIDYLCFSGSKTDRVTEYVDHLHDHFLHPPTVRDGAYFPPAEPGFSIQMTPETLAHFARVDGRGAQAIAAQ